MIRTASALFALALPLLAQDPAAAETEAIFYKAFYLEKGQRDFAGAMALYEQFLAKAPEHKLAAEAAKQQFALLDRTGKTKERDLFKAKFEKLLGNVAETGGLREAGDGPREGGRGVAGGPPRGDQAARVAELEKALAKAKEAGNEEEIKKLTQQIDRLKQAGAGRGAGRGGMLGNKKLAEMTPDELTQFKDGLGRMEAMVERVRENVGEDQAKILEEQIATLKKSLEANKLDEAQKALDAIRAAMPRRRGAEGGGGGGGDRGGNR